MDLETNHGGISPDLSLFHPVTLFPQQPPQMVSHGQREQRDTRLQIL